MPGHEREQFRPKAGHVRSGDRRQRRAHLREAGAYADERPAVRDVVPSETRLGSVRRQRKLRRAWRKDDHDLIAGSEERAERTVEKGLAVDRLDHLLTAKTGGCAAGEKDPREANHGRASSTVAL